MRASTWRLGLALFIDYVLYASLLALLQWLLQPSGITVWWVAGLLAFVVLEVALVRATGSSPGRRTLGVLRRGEALVVARAFEARERWWTVLAGVLGLLEGAKEAVRFTQGLPPPPFMGLTLSWDAAGAIVTTNGLVTMTAGLLVLRVRTVGAALGLAVSLVGLVSWLASWSQIAGWVEARALARQALTGIVARPEQIAATKWMLPLGALLAGAVGTVWLALVLRRFRRIALPSAAWHEDAREQVDAAP